MINYEVRNEIAIITLNNPEKRNALHPDLVKSLRAQLIETANDESIKVLIITGAGKAFCAGADLSYLNELQNNSLIENEKDSRSLAELFLNTYNFPKPVIAAVNGAALAGGCGLASVCDFIVAHPEESKFGYTEVKIGFLPAIVSVFLIKRIGEGSANHLLLSGGVINGKRAYEINLVNYLSYNVLETAIEVASGLCQNSTSSMINTKRMIKSVSNFSIEEAVEYCIGLNTIIRSTEDFRNGLKKFLEK
jgi:methylglutaconyl-CoA hydratase